MDSETKLFTKKRRVKGIPARPFSRSLREIYLQIDAGNTQNALLELDELANIYHSPKEQCEILTAVAKTQLKKGRLLEAQNAYKSALRWGIESGDSVVWSKPFLSYISCLLDLNEPKAAIEAAMEGLAQSKTTFTAFWKALDDLRDAKLRIGTRPLRPQVVLTKIADQFHAKGYLDSAAEFYQQALLLSPNGASRARQGLATIASIADEEALAETYSREALLMGRFAAKTINAWKINIAARFRQGKSGLDEELYASMLAVSQGPVFERSCLVIVHSLREFSDPAWQKVAIEILEKHSEISEIVQCEVLKIYLAELNFLRGFDDIGFKFSKRLLLIQTISPSEVVAAAKDLLIYGVRLNEFSSIAEATSLIGRDFPVELDHKIIHSMALGAVSEGNMEIARQALVLQIKQIKVGTPQWEIDMWALARIEQKTKQFKAASEYFLSLAENTKSSPRFAIQALLSWFQNLAETGSDISFADVKLKLMPMLTGDIHYRHLLDLGRDLKLLLKRIDSNVSLEGINELYAWTRDLGLEKAYKILEREGQVENRLSTLIVVTRRLFHDFFEYKLITSYWQSLTSKQQEELWSQQEIYWEYVTLVYQSFLLEGELNHAQRLAATFLDRDDLPVLGRVYLQTAYANQLLLQGEKEQAFEHFAWLTSHRPNHPLTSWAWYWIALKELGNGNRVKGVESMRRVQRCFSPKPIFQWQHQLVEKSKKITDGVEGQPNPESFPYHKLLPEFNLIAD